MTLRWEFLPVEATDACASEWDELNGATAQMPFLDHVVVRASCRYFGDGTERVALGRENGKLVAAGIVRRPTFCVWQTFQPSQIPLGLWMHESAVQWSEVLWSLMRALPGGSAMFGVTQQDPDIQARPQHGPGLETLDYIETGRVSVRSSFEDYWQARGSNLKQNLRKQRNRLSREAVTVRLQCVRDPANIAAAVDDYGQVESAGWKGAEGTALHRDNAQGRFYRELFEHCAARGEAHVYRYFFNDQLVASDLCVRRNGVLTILKTAFDATHKAMSPSLLMKEQMFQELFADGATRRIEFYGRVMDWHRRFTDEIRVLYHVNLFRWGWLKRLRDLRYRGAQRPTSATDAVPAES